MLNQPAQIPDDLLNANFSELTPAYTGDQARAEANRCLYCYDAPCIKLCPTGIDIPTFIKKIATGNLKGSAKTILASNWIALTCAKACPVAVLCEGSCVVQQQGEPPIAIGRLQRYSLDNYFEIGSPALFVPAPRNGKSVGIVGAGPAGLSCAAELSLIGYEVTVYEKRSLAGGLSTWGIAPYKMSYQDSLREVTMIEKMGVTIKTNTAVGKDISFPELEGKHDAIFLGVGLDHPLELGIPGEDLVGVLNAHEFIESVTRRTWKSVPIGKTVAVIGGGNTAIDAATEAVRLGAERVMILYRRGREEMSAYRFEQEIAKQDGVEFHFLVTPVGIKGTSRVEALTCIRMELGTPGNDGRKKPLPIPGSEFQLPVDMVIKAIGQKTDKSVLAQVPGLHIKKCCVTINPETMQTSNPKYFAGGDCINGGKEVVHAAADGKKAAYGIHKVLSIE